MTGNEIITLAVVGCTLVVLLIYSKSEAWWRFTKNQKKPADATKKSSSLEFLNNFPKLTGKALVGLFILAIGFPILIKITIWLWGLMFFGQPIVSDQARASLPSLPKIERGPRPPTFEEKLALSGKWEPYTGTCSSIIRASDSPKYGFVGVQPPKSPNSWFDIRPGVVTDQSLDFYMVDGDIMPLPQPVNVLSAQKWNGKTRDTTYIIETIFPFRLHMGNEGTKVTPWYLQSSQGLSGNLEINSEIRQARGTKQWWVALDGKEEAAIHLPREGWSYCWIVPIHDPEFLTVFGDQSVQPAGLTSDEMLKLALKNSSLQIKDEQEARLAAASAVQTKLEKIPAEMLNVVGYRGLYFKTADKPEPLVRAVTKEVASWAGTTVKLGINVNPDEAPLKKPARILVGIK